MYRYCVFAVFKGLNVIILQEIYPGQFEPSPCHRFISMLDKQKKLLRNYTQNIDTLEQVAGVQRIIQCHGELFSRVILQFCADGVQNHEDLFILFLKCNFQGPLRLLPVSFVNTRWIVRP